MIELVANFEKISVASKIIQVIYPFDLLIQSRENLFSERFVHMVAWKYLVRIFITSLFILLKIENKSRLTWHFYL